MRSGQKKAGRFDASWLAAGSLLLGYAAMYGFVRATDWSEGLMLTSIIVMLLAGASAIIAALLKGSSIITVLAIPLVFFSGWMLTMIYALPA